MPNYGTLITLDTLATQMNQTVAQLGEDQVFRGIEVALAAHNQILQELMSLLAQRSTDRLRRYGANASITPVKVDEMGMADAQKMLPGSNVGFPLDLYSTSLQWNRKYLQNATGAEFAAQVTALMQGDVRVVNYELKRAVFTPTNIDAYKDRLIDGVTLPIKRFLNADGVPIPDSPSGQVFDSSTHTHYLGTSSFVQADLTALIETVIEHFNMGRPMIFINRAQELTVRGFTAFVPYQDVRIVPPTTAASAPGTELDPINLYNRAIGVFDGAEVWVKPWMPTGYAFATLDGAPKPLVYRTRANDAGNLEPVFDDEEHPLRARAFEREFGLAVWERSNGAVLDTAHSSYTAPTLTV